MKQECGLGLQGVDSRADGEGKGEVRWSQIVEGRASFHFYLF